jgi:hypothetical protein
LGEGATLGADTLLTLGAGTLLTFGADTLLTLGADTPLTGLGEGAMVTRSGDGMTLGARGRRSGEARPLGVMGANGEALTTRTAFPNLASDGESGVATRRRCGVLNTKGLITRVSNVACGGVWYALSAVSSVRGDCALSRALKLG